MEEEFEISKQQELIDIIVSIISALKISKKEKDKISFEDAINDYIEREYGDDDDEFELNEITLGDLAKKWEKEREARKEE